MFVLKKKEDTNWPAQDPDTIDAKIDEHRERLELAAMKGTEVLREAVTRFFEDSAREVQWEDPEDGYTYVEEIWEWGVEDADWYPKAGPYVWVYTTHPVKNIEVTLYGLPVLREYDTITFEVDWQRFDGEPGFR